MADSGVCKAQASNGSLILSFVAGENRVGRSALVGGGPVAFFEVDNGKF